MASHSFAGKDGAQAHSELVLIISNWRFVRDVQSKPVCVCKAEHCTVGFKLSSSEFQSRAVKNGEASGNGGEFNFDKHGAVMPYSAFLTLLNDVGLTNAFIQKIKDRYELDEGSVSAPSELEELEAAIASEQGVGDPNNEEDSASASSILGSLPPPPSPTAPQLEGPYDVEENSGSDSDSRATAAKKSRKEKISRKKKQ